MPSKRVSLKGKGADLFFGDYAPPIRNGSKATADEPGPTVPSPPTAVPTSDPTTTPPVVRPGGHTPRARRSPQPRVANTRDDAPTATHNGDSGVASKRASDLVTPDPTVIDGIRKVVKVPGREVSFVRLTPAEKAQLAEIVYAYKRRGQKTSENEINRIALNYLLRDYQEHGEQSVLARVLAALVA
jgi:hypothetical protein